MTKIIKVVDAKNKKLLREDYKDFIFHPGEKITDENILVKCIYCRKNYIEYVLVIEDDEGNIVSEEMCKNCINKERKKLKAKKEEYYEE